MKDRGAARTGLVAVAALAVLAGLTGPVARAAPAEDDHDVAAYRPEGRPLRGTATARNAPFMEPVGTEPGGSHVDSVGAGETRHYRVRLDGESTAYVSAVAVPPPGSPVSAFRDGVELTLAGPDGKVCDQVRPTAGAVDLAYPLAGYVTRIKRPGAGAACQEAGTYDFAVARTDGPGGAGTRPPGGGAHADPGEDGEDSARWPLELRFTQEPAVRGGPTAPPSPGSWPTEPPALPGPSDGEPGDSTTGGADFRRAGPLHEGVWRTRIAPGETRYFRLRLDWGQQIYAEAELPDAGPPPDGASGTGASGDRSGQRPLGDAFGVSLYNPMRGLVQRGDFPSYGGQRVKDALERTAPVAYGNRYTRARSEVRAVSFAGLYYVAVTLHPDVARYFGESVPVTLRIGVEGEPRPGPEYVRDAGDLGFGLQRPPTGLQVNPPSDDGPDGALRAVAYAGFGTGTALLLGLGVWTVVARRRSAGAGG